MLLKNRLKKIFLLEENEKSDAFISFWARLEKVIYDELNWFENDEIFKAYAEKRIDLKKQKEISEKKKAMRENKK